MRIKIEPIDVIKPHPSNPRVNHDVDGIARSIQAFGWQQPLVVYDGDGCLLVGHGRLLAAKQLGLDKVPVKHVAADELTPREAAAYRLADNRSAEGSQWDDMLLLAEVDELEARERELAGFDEAYRDALAERLAAIEVPEVDAAAEWDGMPEFAQDDLGAFQSIHVHLRDQAAVDRLAELVDQKITPRTRSLWFPPAPLADADRYADKRYSAAGEPAA